MEAGYYNEKKLHKPNVKRKDMQVTLRRIGGCVVMKTGNTE